MLKVEGLTKIFGGLRAVDNASIEVPEGRIVALIGPNGAGKTTLFACIAGFHQPNAGRVTLMGQDITGKPVHDIARLGMVRTFQITQPFAKLSVHENIAVGAYQKFPDRHQAWEHARRIGEQGLQPVDMVAPHHPVIDLGDRPRDNRYAHLLSVIAQSAISTHTGAWSLAFSRPR